jgi:5-methylcytosine-specific restriction endonuclease McrA
MLATLAEFERAPRILRLNVAGQPVEWVTWQEAVCLYARELVVWTLGDAIVKIRGGHSRLDGTRSTVDIHSIVACEGRVVPPARHIPPLTNLALFARDGNVCLYCAHEYSDRELTRDHVVPKSRGGRDTWDNVVAACRRCNHRKGDRLLHESNMELMALPYVPNFAEYLALINSGRILGDQMDFLKSQFGSESRLLH